MSDLNEEKQIMKERENNSLKIDKELFFNRPISDLELMAVKSVSSKSILDEAVKLMQQYNIGSIVIVDNKKVVGILTERDILMKVSGKSPDNSKIYVSDIMTKNPFCLRATDAVMYVMNNMHLGHFRHIPIVNELDEPISMISVRDLLNYFFTNFSAEISNTMDHPFRGPKNREDGA
ncbi:MAG: CBS domain-containing protein [Bacteriovoracaceae bacterium]